MTTKEKVINESISRITKRLTYLESIQNANPVTDLLNIREEAQKLLVKNKTVQERTSESFISKINELSKREKKCWKLIERQKNWEKDSNEMARLQVELSQLKRELYYIKTIR